MINNEFKKNYLALNKEQKEAVDTIEGPVMVIAGPGTGKTQILTLRIANILLKTQINPENILALTFSEAASFEMRDRLSKIIGTPAYRTEISTFHSFANSIIKNYPEEFPTLLSSESITELEQIELIEKLISKLALKLLKPFGEPLYFLKDILQAINDLKKEGIDPEELAVAIKKQEIDFENTDDLYHEKGKYGPKVCDDGVVTKGEMKGVYQSLKKDIEKTKEFLEIFKNYQKSLMEERKYDFNDMLLQAVKVLQTNRPLLLRIQEKFQYILVDEHQDTNASQNKLIELVASFYETPNLFVVGDEKQAIYRFQGASLENFLYFKKIYPKAKLINLTKNYRSHKIILDASGGFIEKNISANILPQKKLLAESVLKKEKIQIAALADYHMEYEFIASDIAGKFKKSLKNISVAVLARRNMDLLPLSQSLERRGIKFIIQADLNIIKDLQIQKLLILLEAIGNPFDEVFLLKVMHLDFLGLEPIDVYKILNYSKKEKIAFIEIIGKINKTLTKELSLENPGAVINFYKKYKEWIKLEGNIAFDDLFVKIVNESGFREYLLKLNDRYSVLNKLTGLFDEIKKHINKNPEFNLQDFLRFLQTIEKHKISLQASQENSLEDGVRLLTVHKAKGLEFDFVYIINCFDSRWGNSKKRGAKIKIPWEYFGQNIKADISFEEIEDERRLFYVGITRAKQGLCLSYSKFGIDGKEQLPSQFLSEIEPRFFQQINVSDFEKSFDKSELFNESRKIIIDPKNEQYLRSIFLEKGLSATGLENFLRCPWKYFFRNLVALPDVKSKQLIFGTAIHFALESFIKLRNARKLDATFMVNKFNESLDGAGLLEKERTEVAEKGKKALGLLYEKVIPTWPKNIQSELQIKGVRLSDNVILNGRIDMIEPLTKGGLVRVHDFKTGKIKSRSQIDGSSEKSKYNYFRQLTFYKMLLDRYKEGIFNMHEGVIDFVEPDEKERFRSEVFAVTNKDVKGLEELIEQTADQIMNLKFWDKKCDDEVCEYCKLAEMVFK